MGGADEVGIGEGFEERRKLSQRGLVGAQPPTIFTHFQGHFVHPEHVRTLSWIGCRRQVVSIFSCGPSGRLLTPALL